MPVSAIHHVREHGSLLAAPERRLLIWIAQRLPRAITSDHLTLLALASMALAGAAFAAARITPHALWLVVVALGLNWFGDSLDGTLARVRRVERPGSACCSAGWRAPGTWRRSSRWRSSSPTCS
jgi:hypothetical protein